MKHAKTAILLVLVFLLAGCSALSDEMALDSPGFKMQLIFKLKEGRPYYALNKNGEPIILDSELGMELLEMPNLDANFIVLDRSVESFNETWEQAWGEARYIENRYTELKVFLQEAEGLKRKMNIIFRVYDDGLGIRYEFPKQNNLKEFRITREKTQFSLIRNDSAWWIPAYMPERYEYLYRKTLISEMDTAHTPMTLKTGNGHYLCFHEAALYDYPSYTIYCQDTSTLALDLVPWKDSEVKAFMETPCLTPWRSVMIADQPGDLVTNYLTLNLSDTCQLTDVSWIKPAKYVGIWWGMHIDENTWGSGPIHGATTRNTMKYIDFAAENGFGGVLVEGWNIGWDGNWIQNGEIFSFTKSYADFDLPFLAKYAWEKGVSLIGHHETSGNIENYEKQMEDAYKLYENLGVKYIKTGYVGTSFSNGEWHHGQYGVRHYQRSVELAAKHQLMLDVHEPIKDCGLRRTWPNLMTREGARGMEYNAWSPDGGNPPSHVPTLVFTRLLAGPMDYTPGIFDLQIENKPDNRVNTTLAKQLAYYVVIYSPLQMAADLPEHYRGNPAFQFIRDVPCDWEETRVLNAEIGKYVTIARKDRNSLNWYLGSITNGASRTFDIPLDFLDEDVIYDAVIYADGPDADWKTKPEAIAIQTKKGLSSEDILKVKLAAGGGQAIAFVAR
ncbi:MAG: glycoside hydrolase family 97 protein [Bacteroidales bacterium]|nr:glycoside hydrolase family 97 protein [Bacteroidales bacterium]